MAASERGRAKLEGGREEGGREGEGKLMQEGREGESRKEGWKEKGREKWSDFYKCRTSLLIGTSRSLLTPYSL